MVHKYASNDGKQAPVCSREQYLRVKRYRQNQASAATTTVPFRPTKRAKSLAGSDYWNQSMIVDDNGNE